MDNDPQSTPQPQFNAPEPEPVMPTEPVPAARPEPANSPTFPIEPVPTQPPKKSKKKLIIFLIIIAILLAGGGVAGALILFPDLLSKNSTSVTTSKAKTTATATSKTTSKTTEELQEDAIRAFFALLNKKRFAEAVDSMASAVTSSEAAKQSMISGYANWSSVEIISIRESGIAETDEAWTINAPQYIVSFNVVFDPTMDDNTPYNNGLNSRFVRLVQENGAWKVDSLPTGP